MIGKPLFINCNKIFFSDRSLKYNLRLCLGLLLTLQTLGHWRGILIHAAASIQTNSLTPSYWVSSCHQWLKAPSNIPFYQNFCLLSIRDAYVDFYYLMMFNTVCIFIYIYTYLYVCMYKLRYWDEICIIYKQDIFHCALQKCSQQKLGK